MKTSLKLITLLIVANVCMIATAIADTPITAGSAWTNQRGSTLYVDAIDPSGKLTGHYINRAQGYNCQNIPYPVTGWVYGTAITFTTIWRSAHESCNSITAWTGFFNAQGQMPTQWQLVISGKNQILKGEDTFTRSAKTTQESLSKKK